MCPLPDAAKAIQFGSALLERRGLAGRVAGWAVDLLLVLVCGILLAKLFWAIMAPASLVQVSGRTASTDAPRASNLSLIADPRVLQEFNPFDRNMVQAEIVETTDAPETTLNLEIAGLWSSNDPASTFVRIRTPDDQVRRFRVGDTVVSGVTIDRILNDRVILVRNGQKEALLQREMKVLGTVAPDRVETRSASIASPPTQQAVPQPTPEKTFLSSKSIELPSVADFNAKIEMVRKNDPSGQPRLMISDNSDWDTMNNLSVETGDVLLSVNGQEIDVDQLPQLYQELQTQKVLTFVLDRNGQRFTRIVNIRNGVGD